MKKFAGYTLLELIIVVGIIGVVTAIAVPSMSVYIKNDRLTTQINTLVGHLAYARSEAVTRSVQVGLCAANTAYDGCVSGTSWASGWILFVDADANSAYTAGEEILRVKQVLEGGNTLKNSAGNMVVYDSRGFTPASNSTFSLCDDRLTDNLKSISISVTGRVRKGGATAC